MRWLRQIRIRRDGLDLAAAVNAAIVVNYGEPGTSRTAETAGRVRVVQSIGPRRQTGDSVKAPVPVKQEVSMDEQTPSPSDDELERSAGEEPSDHPSTSLPSANVAIPVNAEVAANVLSSSADAGAHASTETSGGDR